MNWLTVFLAKGVQELATQESLNEMLSLVQEATIMTEELRDTMESLHCLVDGNTTDEAHLFVAGLTQGIESTLSRLRREIMEIPRNFILRKPPESRG